MKREKRKKAVALTFNEAADPAPRVTAKGQGRIAEAIIQRARENDVPVREDPSLAELLLKIDLDEVIPESLYQAVAEIFALIYRADQRAKELRKDKNPQER
jgi:flagellar biosynthesis protein